MCFKVQGHLEWVKLMQRLTHKNRSILSLGYGGFVPQTFYSFNVRDRFPFIIVKGVNGVPLKSVISKVLVKKSVISKI